MSFVDDLTKKVVDSIKGKTTSYFGVNSGSAGGYSFNSIANVPKIGSSNGYGPVPPTGGYGPDRGAGQAGTGFSGGGFTQGAGRVAGGVAAAVIASLPPIQQQVSLDLLSNRGMGFGLGSYAGVQGLQRQLSGMSTVTSPLDAAQALGKLSMGGFAGTNLKNSMQSTAFASNILPGLSAAGGADVLQSMNAPQNVNAAKAVGINIRNSKGMPNSIPNVIEQLWAWLQNNKRGSGPITSDMLQVSLLPGGALDSMINLYFGGDSTLRQTIITGLTAKASGVTDLTSKSQLKAHGFTTGTILAQSSRDTAALAKDQSVLGGTLAGWVQGRYIRCNLA